jgi:hypothetical protein
MVTLVHNISERSFCTLLSSLLVFSSPSPSPLVSPFSSLPKSLSSLSSIQYPKNAFDAGEYGLGRCANSLKLGCDCLGEIHYFDTAMIDSKGEVIFMKNAVCMHEEDYGILVRTRTRRKKRKEEGRTKKKKRTERRRKSKRTRIREERVK